MDQRGRDRRVDPARQGADDPAISHLIADELGRLRNEGPCGPGRRAVADAEQEVAQHLTAAGRVDDLGVELDADDSLVVGEGRDRRVAAGREKPEAGRHLAHVVAMAHPDRQVAVQATEDAARLLDGQQCGPILAGMSGVDLASQVVGDQLHAVADAEHRDTGAERLRVELRRVRVVDAGGPAAEDQARGLAPLQLLPGRRAWNELAVDVRFADAARDQLAELRAIVEDEDGLLTRPGRGLNPPGRGGLVQLLPIPTCWACWNTLPSETIDGAITSSTCWNSAMSRAPHTPSAERIAPAKF